MRSNFSVQISDFPTLTHISWKASGYQIGGNNFFGLPTKRRAKQN